MLFFSRAREGIPAPPRVRGLRRMTGEALQHIGLIPEQAPVADQDHQVLIEAGIIDRAAVVATGTEDHPVIRRSISLIAVELLRLHLPPALEAGYPGDREFVDRVLHDRT